MSGEFNYKGMRAQKARFARVVATNGFRDLLLLVTIFLFGGGLAVVLVMGASFGWVIAAAATPSFMLLMWIIGELCDIPPEQSSTIDGLISSDLLGRIPNNASPQLLAQTVMTLHGGQFFMARFGLMPDFLPSRASSQAQDSAAVWQYAEQLQQQLGAKTISAPLLFVALAHSVPRLDAALAPFKIDSQDLLQGAIWYLHIQDAIVARRQKSHQDGGVGRDWSFGYTPLLTRFGVNVSERVGRGIIHRELEGHDQTLAQIMKLLAQAGRGNAALVGPAKI